MDAETPRPMLEALAREALVVRLSALGQSRPGKGAKLLGISRRAFLALLDQYGVSWFDDAESFSELPKQD